LLVFSQIPELRLDPAGLLRAARQYFDAELEVLAELADGEATGLHVRLSARSHAGEFVIRPRAVSAEDLVQARHAEHVGRAAGMAGLAARCPTAWVIEAREPRSEAALLNLCAVLAAVALGPVLPDDCSTLFGVRGAMERVARLLAADAG
jgi:hypothetical protein